MKTKLEQNSSRTNSVETTRYSIHSSTVQLFLFDDSGWGIMRAILTLNIEAEQFNFIWKVLTDNIILILMGTEKICMKRTVWKFDTNYISRRETVERRSMWIRLQNNLNYWTFKVWPWSSMISQIVKQIMKHTLQITLLCYSLFESIGLFILYHLIRPS